MQQDIYQPRQYIIQVVMVLGIVALIGKCFQLQVWDESYQKQHSYRQALTLYPSRGLVYDRNGELLIYNRAIYDLQATYNTVKKNNIDTNEFCRLLGIDRATFEANMDKDFSTYRYSKRKPFEFMSKVPADSFAKFEEHLYKFPGFESIRKNVRGYLVHSGAHILGYISEVNKKDIRKSNKLYKSGDYIGKSGLESNYEIQLRGERGKKHVLKDKFNRIKGRYKKGDQDSPASSGYDLITSLDIELQAYAEELMQNKRGAVVAIEPSTGEILSMVSAPYYDPSILAVDLNRQNAFLELSQDPSKPLFNRALTAKYPPGSIFKTIMSAIALQEGVLTPNRSIPCGGAYRYGSLRIGCHGHGATSSVANAIRVSCNNYYCQVYKELVNLYGFNHPEKGLQRLTEHLNAFGLGKKLGVDIPGEAAGSIPSVDFYNKRYGQGRWKFSHGVSVGIGQGELEVTPLQMANIAAIIANRGYYYIPHFAKEFMGEESNILEKYKQRNYTKVLPVHFDAVIDGMESVVTAGTGRRAKIPGITVCGKTGTVENPHGKDHSTFIAFAPKENPKIAIAVYVENGGYGSTYAAPISSLIIEKYLRGEIQGQQRQALEKRMLEADLVNIKKTTSPSTSSTEEEALESIEPNNSNQ
ncbi:MAG: penicillin-binding protein 2 [Saprospiraceae bacterium]|nr:penicillin-binding protein 2 [Saprospiraceae bacterium]